MTGAVDEVAKLRSECVKQAERVAQTFGLEPERMGSFRTWFANCLSVPGLYLALDVTEQVLVQVGIELRRCSLSAIARADCVAHLARRDRTRRLRCSLLDCDFLGHVFSCFLLGFLAGHSRASWVR
jgi:hypothetical protein